MLNHTDVQFEEALTKRAVGILEDRADFAVVNGAIPMIPTEVFNGTYKVWSLADFRRRNAEKRAGGTDFKRVNTNLKDVAFKCEQEGYEQAIDDRDTVANALEDISLDMVEDGYANYDIRLLEKIAGAGFETKAITNKWNTAGSNPIKDIKEAKSKLHTVLGVDPDSLLITEDVYIALTENETILARLRTDADKEITAQKLAQFFGLKNLYVMNGSATGTADGIDQQMIGKIGEAKALLYYRGTAMGAYAPSTIKCFYNTKTYGAGNNGIVIQSYRDERRTSDVLRLVQDFTIEVTMKEGGLLLTNVL